VTPFEISVVIPVYRSAKTLHPLIERLLPVLESITPNHEVVFVEDGSPDDSWHVLGEVRSLHPGRIVVVQLMRNYGQHNALMCGFRHARGDLIVTMDDDLQNPPEEIPKLVSAIRAGEFDLVYGSYESKQHAGWRNIGSLLVNTFFRLFFHTEVTVTSFRVIRRELLESIFPYTLNYTFIDGLLAWNTQRIGQVAVEHHARQAGRSGYSLKKLLILAFNLFTNFSLLPLQLVSAMGLFSALGGFLVALVFLMLYLFSNITVPGYASIIISILVMGGIQLMALGIMGEYLGRLHLNVNGKPQYAVRHVLGLQGARPATAVDHFGKRGINQDPVVFESQASSLALLPLDGFDDRNR
jgi:undecaprenyl-phosphate 4-deoxy-4-formamido-L-arabinose transferase